MVDSWAKSRKEHIEPRLPFVPENKERDWSKTTERKAVRSSFSARAPKSQPAFEQPSAGRHRNLPKKIPRIQGQRRSHNGMVGMAQSQQNKILLKKEFTGPGLHMRPVHADHARPPLQWTLDSALNAYGNCNRRIRPPLDRGLLKITSRLLIA